VPNIEIGLTLPHGSVEDNCRFRAVQIIDLNERSFIKIEIIRDNGVEHVGTAQELVHCDDLIQAN
jgi:hypothetical protein